MLFSNDVIFEYGRSAWRHMTVANTSADGGKSPNADEQNHLDLKAIEGIGRMKNCTHNLYNNTLTKALLKVDFVIEGPSSYEGRRRLIPITLKLIPSIELSRNVLTDVITSHFFLIAAVMDLQEESAQNK